MQEYKHRLVPNLYVDDCLGKPGRIPMRLYFVISNLLLEKARQQEDTGEGARKYCKPSMFECCYGRHENKQHGPARGNISPLTEKL